MEGAQDTTCDSASPRAQQRQALMVPKLSAELITDDALVEAHGPHSKECLQQPTLCSHGSASLPGAALKSCSSD